MRILSHDSQSFGKGIGKSISEWSRILRQAVGKEVLDLMFTENRFHGVTRIYRKYILSDKGNNFLKTPIDTTKQQQGRLVEAKVLYAEGNSTCLC